MANPPRAIKITKDGIEYLNNVDRVNYTLEELGMAALRDVGRFLQKEARSRAPRKTENLIKNISVFARKKAHDLQLGIYKDDRAKKKGLKPAFYGKFFELGTSKMTARPFLEPSVKENIETIRRIQGQYLSAIEDENQAMGLIDDTWEEMEVGEDG